jgi:hypothetical protein
VYRQAVRMATSEAAQQVCALVRIVGLAND